MAAHSWKLLGDSKWPAIYTKKWMNSSRGERIWTLGHWFVIVCCYFLCASIACSLLVLAFSFFLELAGVATLLLHGEALAYGVIVTLLLEVSRNMLSDPGCALFYGKPLVRWASRNLPFKVGKSRWEEVLQLWMVLKPQDGTCSGFASLWNVRLSSLTRSISPEWQLGSDLSLTLFSCLVNRGLDIAKVFFWEDKVVWSTIEQRYQQQRCERHAKSR